MRTSAVIVEKPGRLSLATTPLTDPRPGELVIETTHSGISSGTERLLWEGRMPAFPGLGYPLVPGYEAVGTIVDGDRSRIGEHVFVPGARCFTQAHALFGGAARTLVVPAERVVANPFGDARGVLLALAATAHHMFAAPSGSPPELIIGHGTVGRLLARVTVACGAAPPTVWEIEPTRRADPLSAEAIDPAEDARRDYNVICDCSGSVGVLDQAMPHLARGGEIVLAGFYATPVQFAFPPAFMREARLRIAAEWQPSDMAAVVALIEHGALSLDGLITDEMPARDAAAAYERAFTKPECLKMTLDWSEQ